jgi:hypothetical protein
VEVLPKKTMFKPFENHSIPANQASLAGNASAGVAGVYP